MSIGSFILIKNEAQFIGAHLEMWLPFLDQMVFLDGNSTDGTWQIILDAIHNHKYGYKIKLFMDKDPKDLQDDYVRLFNEAIGCLETDLAFFLHPDMIPSKLPANLDHLKDAVAASVDMRSFGGEPGGKLFEIAGRGQKWKNIYRNKNPDLRLHYAGWYGSAEEDCYFKAITGKNHVIYEDFNRYPYKVVPSGIEVLHFSDVRPLERRIDRMVKCLKNNAWPDAEALARAERHPRVTFENGGGFKFEPAEWPAEFTEARAKYSHLERKNTLVNA